jgi:uncharacterized protein (UPF0332 family)
MTDKDTLLLYRLKQAEETLADAEMMYREGHFSLRQKGDYKELVEISNAEVGEHVKLAREFFDVIKNYIERTEG